MNKKTAVGIALLAIPVSAYFGLALANLGLEMWLVLVACWAGIGLGSVVAIWGVKLIEAGRRESAEAERKRRHEALLKDEAERMRKFKEQTPWKMK